MESLVMSSLYVGLRCPSCKISQTYANTSDDRIVCDYCVHEFNKWNNTTEAYVQRRRMGVRGKVQ